MFHDFSPDQLRLLDSIMEPCAYPQDTLIFEQGQIATCLFILVQGEVAIRYKPYDGPTLMVAHILPGGVFGWSAALGRDAYTSGAVAQQDCRALRINGAGLHHFCDRNPSTGALLLERLAGAVDERLRHTHHEILTILTEGMDLSDNGRRRLEKDG